MKRSSAFGRFLSRFGLELFLVALVAILFSDYLFSDQLLYGSDSIPTGLYHRDLVVQFVKDFGQLPRWDPFVLGGLPFLDALHGDTFYPLSAIHWTMPVYRAMGHKLLLNIALAGVFMAFYLRTVRLSFPAVAFGSIAYCLCPLFVSHLYTGQDGRSYVVALTPLVLGSLERAMRSSSVRAWILTALTIAATIVSAQIQMAYHLLWYVAALFAVRLVFPFESDGQFRRVRAGAAFAGAIAVALLVGSVQLLPAVAYVKHPAEFSVRSDRTDYEHATSWSLHPEEIASMVVPQFCDAPRGYWGRNPFKYNSDYIGIAVVFLAALALSRRRDSTRWYLFGISLFSVVYALGGHTPLHRLFYDIVPQVKLFRAPSLVLFGGAFGMCALAAHALHDLDVARTPPVRVARNVLFVGLLAAAILAVVGLSAGAVYSLWDSVVAGSLTDSQRRVQLENLPAFRSGAWTAAGVLAAVATLAWMRMRGRVDSRAVLIVLGFITILDSWRVDESFKVLLAPERFTRPDAFIAPIADESQREKFRVMPVVAQYAQNELAYFGIESALGFHDNELAWYRRLRADPRAQGLLVQRNGSFPLLRLLNVKYVIHDSPDYPNPLPVPGYLPRFWVVDEYDVEPNTERILERMLSEDFDPAHRAILEVDPGVTVERGEGEAAIVRSYEYDANVIRVTVDAARPCLLMHSENWFPYWHAFRGGEELPILRADGVIRAIPLPTGVSDLEFRFVSRPFEIGKWITLATLLLLAIVLLITGGRRRRSV